MKQTNLWRIFAALLIVSIMLVGCAPAAAPTDEEPAAEAPAAEEAAMEMPTDVKIAVIMGATIDEPWYKALLNAFDRFSEDNEHGLKISYDYTENVWGDDAERAMRAYAESGEYDIIWAHTSYSNEVNNMKDEYPEMLFVFSGSGNEGLGGNAYYIYAHVHECAYLLGMTAGLMTETNMVGSVAGFPYDDVNDVLNGFMDGAKSVNEDIQVKITFIESWWDPPKAKEATYALLAAGADMIYAERFGPFEALQEKGVLGFGQYEDQYEMSPDVVVTSTILKWDPHVDYILGEWWSHVVDGKAYEGTIDPVWFGIQDGGCEIAPFHDDKAPQDVQDAVLAAYEQIKSGDLVVELKVDPPESD